MAKRKGKVAKPEPMPSAERVTVEPAPGRITEPVEINVDELAVAAPEPESPEVAVEAAVEAVAPEPASEVPAETPAEVAAEPAKPRPFLMLPPNLAVLGKIAGDNMRYALSALNIQETDEGYRVEATDTRRLAVVTGPSEGADEFPDVSGLRGPLPEKQALLPVRVFEKACKSVPTRAYKEHLKRVAVRLGATSSVLAATDLDCATVLEPRNVEGRFPDAEKVFPNRKPKVQFSVDAKMLADLLQVAVAFALEGSNRVDVLVYGEKEPVELRTTTNEKGQKFRGLIVPLS
jgi:hypothetical protein